MGKVDLLLELFELLSDIIIHLASRNSQFGSVRIEGCKGESNEILLGEGALKTRRQLLFKMTNTSPADSPKETPLAPKSLLPPLSIPTVEFRGEVVLCSV